MVSASINDNARHEPGESESDSSSLSDYSGFRNFMTFNSAPTGTNAPPPTRKYSSNISVSDIPKHVRANKPVEVSDDSSTDDSVYGDFLSFVKNETSAPRVTPCFKAAPVAKKRMPRTQAPKAVTAKNPSTNFKAPAAKVPSGVKATPSKSPSVRHAAAAPVHVKKTAPVPALVKKTAPAPVKKAAPTHAKALFEKAEHPKASPVIAPKSTPFELAYIEKTEPFVRSTTVNTMTTSASSLPSNPATSSDDEPEPLPPFLMA